MRSFGQKIIDQRSQIPSGAIDPSDSRACIAEWSEFQPVTVSILKDIVQKLKPTFYVNNMIPSRLLKQVFDSVHH